MTALVLLALALPADPPKEPDYEALLNDRMAAGVTPETNANVLLWKALGPRPPGEGAGMPAEYFKRLGIPEPPADGEYFVGSTAYLKSLNPPPDRLKAFNEGYDQATRGPWVAADHILVANWLAANEKPLAVVVEATKRPGYYNPLVSRRGKDGKPTGLIGALLPSVQPARELAHALRARAMLRFGEGKPDDAWADVLAAHRLGRLVGRGGTLIEALVGYAIDGVAAAATLTYLEHPGLTADTLRGRLRDLQALPPVPPVADNIDRGERLFYLDSLQTLRRGGDGSDPEKVKAAQQLDWALIGRDGAKWFDRMVAALRKPTRAEREKALGAIEAELRKLKGDAPKGNDALHALMAGKDGFGPAVSQQISNVLVSLLTPAVGKVAGAYDRSVQTDRNLQVAVALAAYRADRGTFPAKLADLAPGYLKAVPDDLFSGEPLVYKPAEKGYLLYSVGLNGKDDGGPRDGTQVDDFGVRVPAK